MNDSSWHNSSAWFEYDNKLVGLDWIKQDQVIKKSGLGWIISRVP